MIKNIFVIALMCFLMGLGIGSNNPALFGYSFLLGLLILYGFTFYDN